MGTAVITRAKTGKKEYYSDGKKVSKRDYNKQVQKDTQRKLDRSARRSGKKKSSARAEIIGGEVKVVGVQEAPIVAIEKKTRRKLTKTDLLIEKNKALLQEQPKGSYKVTRPDGTVVYRLHGQTAQGTYVKDVYQRLQKDQQVKVGTSTYKTIPKSAKKIQTREGEVYRQFNTYNGQTVVTDYKPGGVKETKILTTTYRGGESQFIPKPKDEAKQFLPPTPVIDTALSIKGDGGPIPKASLSQYAETLIKREQRLEDLKGGVYEALRIKGKENAKWYNVLEIGKGVARVPFEIASLPVFIYGRGNLAIRSVFDKAGRQELKASLGETPSAIRSIYITKDTETGKYKLTAQNVVNIGLTGLSVRGVAKSPSNVGLKTFEKYAKTNIKGSIRGYQGTFVFKSAGKYKGRPYKELTIIKDGKTTSTINYQGKQFLVTRGKTGAGTFKITTTKRALKIDRKGPIPKRVRIEKEVVILKTGKIKPGEKPISFKTEKGVTTQDIRFLDERALSKTYINYLEQLKTRATAQAKIKSGGQQLKFDAKTNIKVKADLKGVVTSQRTALKELSFKDAQAKITLDYKRPKIEFAKKPVNPKDVVIKEFVKEGKAIIGTREGTIAQPRNIFVGPKDAFVKGEFTITGGKGFNFLSPLKVSNPFKGISNIPKNLYGSYKLNQLRKLIKKQADKNQPIDLKLKPVTRPKSKETTFDFSKSILQKSKQGEQILLTEQVLAEQIPVFQIPFKTQAPKLQFQSLNFDVLSQAPIGSRPLPLVPTISKSIQEQKPAFFIDAPTPIKPPSPVYKVRTFQEVRPTDIITAKTFLDQGKDVVTNIKAGQRATSRTSQRPVNVIKQLQEQRQKPAQVQSSLQTQKQEQVFKSVFESQKVTQKFQPFEFKQFQPVNFLAGPRFDFGGKAQPQGFNVLTRIKGVFKKANIKPLSKQDAINYGAYKVGTTSQATFKIVEAGTTAQDTFKFQTDLKDFYKKDDLFIEKKGRRIKSIGELQEITFKGIASRKRKSIFGGK